MADIYEQAVAFHKKHQGKLKTVAVEPITDTHALSLVYTPGVAEPSRLIAKDTNASFDLTLRGRTVGIVSDGSAVLGLGNIGPEAAMPVMEGKALLLAEFAGVDSFPLVISAKSPDEVVSFVKQVAPSFGAINLEDIGAPACFQIEESLQDLGIPVFHDDQHGTAIVVAAALQNAAKVVGKAYSDLNVVIVGAGAAGLATAKMLMGMECQASSCRLIPGQSHVHDVIVVDSSGAIHPHRENLNVYKQAVAGVSNRQNKRGSLAEVIKGADAVIGVSGPETISKEMVASMAQNAIVFALANPIPEIMPDLAKEAGATVIATGRSDYPNQINNVLAFPAIFKVALDLKLPRIDMHHKLALVQALAEMVPSPVEDKVLPNVFEDNLVERLVSRVKELIA